MPVAQQQQAAQAKHPAKPRAPPPAAGGVHETKSPLKPRRRRTDRYIPGWMLWVHIPAFLPRHISFSQQFPNVGLVAVKSEPALFFLVRISFRQKQKTQFQLSSPIGTLPIRARPRLAWSVCEFARRRVTTVGAEASMVREQCPLLAVRRRVNASGFRYPQNFEVWDAETEPLS